MAYHAAFVGENAEAAYELLSWVVCLNTSTPRASEMASSVS